MMNSSESLEGAPYPSISFSESAASRQQSRKAASLSPRASFQDIAASIAAKSRPTATAIRPPEVLSRFWNIHANNAQGYRPSASVISRPASLRSSFVSHATSDTPISGNTSQSHKSGGGYKSTSSSRNVSHPGKPVISSGSRVAAGHTIVTQAAVTESPPSHIQSNSKFNSGSTTLASSSDDANTVNSEYAENGIILGSITSLSAPRKTENRSRPPPISSTALLPPDSDAKSSLAFSFTHVKTSDSMMYPNQGKSASTKSAAASTSRTGPSLSCSSSNYNEDLRTVASESLSLTPTMVEKDLLNESSMITQSKITAAAANFVTASAANQKDVSQGQCLLSPTQQLFMPVEEADEGKALQFQLGRLDQDKEDATSHDSTDSRVGGSLLLPFIAEGNGDTNGLSSLANIVDECIAPEDENRTNVQVPGAVGAVAGAAALWDLVAASNEPNESDVAPPATLEPDMILCPFCQSEKDLKWHLHHERRQHSWIYHILVAALVIALMVGSFFAGSVSARQSYEPVLASYAQQCQEKLTEFQEEHFQRQEQLLQLAEMQRLQLAEREEMAEVAIRTQQEQQDTSYLPYIMGTGDYLSAFTITALGGVASDLSGIFTSYFFGDGSCV